MLRNLQLKLISFIPLIFASCGKDPFCNCLEPSGKFTSQERSQPYFNKIEIENNVNINIYNSTEFKTIISCGKNLLDGVETSVENGTMYIRNKNRCNWMRNPKNEFNVDVYTPQLTDIIFRGSGQISCIDTIKSDELKLECWSATGAIKLLLDCKNSYLYNHTGSADIIAEGTAHWTRVYNAGSGFVKAEGLESSNVNVNSESTGDCFVNSNSYLWVKINYKGDVYYSGQPSTIESHILNTGRLIRF